MVVVSCVVRRLCWTFIPDVSISAKGMFFSGMWETRDGVFFATSTPGGNRTAGYYCELGNLIVEKGMSELIGGREGVNGFFKNFVGHSGGGSKIPVHTGNSHEITAIFAGRRTTVCRLPRRALSALAGTHACLCTI